MPLYPGIFAAAAPVVSIEAPEPIGLGHAEAGGGSTASLTATFRNLADDADQQAEAGDFVLALITVRADRTLNTPADWTTLIDQTPHSSSTNFRCKLVGRLLPSSQSSQDFTISSATAAWAVACAVIRGVHETPIDVISATFDEGLSTSPTAPAETTTQDKVRIIRVAAIFASPSVTGEPETPIMARANTGGFPFIQALAHKEQASAGSTGTAAWTISSSQRWLTATVGMAAAEGA